jgi:hypothetical protein
MLWGRTLATGCEHCTSGSASSDPELGLMSSAGDTNRRTIKFSCYACLLAHVRMCVRADDDLGGRLVDCCRLGWLTAS